MWILNDIRYAALGDDTAALCARLRSELYDPVCPRKNMRVMIHKDDGISVRNKIVHYAGKAVNPIDGSSSTYSTPVVRLRTALASCIRCRSPVDSVEEDRSSDK